MKGNYHSAVQTSSVLNRGDKPQSVTTMDRWLVRKMLELVGNPPFSVTFWNGEVYQSHPHVVASLYIHDRGALYKLLIYPELYFGDLYSASRVDVEGDLVQFLQEAYLTMGGTADNKNPLLRLMQALQRRTRSNTLQGSRKNIYQHYDIGNDFYALWLDKAVMQYTCAYYPTPEASLEVAQVAKLHHICRKLGLREGETVVEAGCGWGGLARFMARHYGVKVKAYNISHRQLCYAREQAQKEGLQDRVEYVEDDYRNIRGEFDAFVSVGMLEHVGTENYRELGSVIDRVLKPEGRGLIHTIGGRTTTPMNAWIERRIFPGAYPPTLREMMAIFEPKAFSVFDVENLRPHYTKTLTHWLARFEEQQDVVQRMFDEAFVRAWRLYLAGSIAAFRSGDLELYQVIFSRSHNTSLPWTRAQWYQASGKGEISHGAL